MKGPVGTAANSQPEQNQRMGERKQRKGYPEIEKEMPVECGTVQRDVGRKEPTEGRG